MTMKLYHEKLAKLVQSKPNAIETLRMIVQRDHVLRREIPAAVRALDPKVEMDDNATGRLLRFFVRWGIVFRHNESSQYFPTTFAHRIVWDESAVEWLPSAVLALSIITKSTPGTDVIQVLSEELRLDKRKAEAIRNVFGHFLKKP